jgi:ribose 1,5-bisphosphokinase
MFLIVGPSGAGKDTLIEAARNAFANIPSVVFPRRIITRPSDAVGEDHIGVSETEFETRLEAGAFSLHWTAHGLRYALPAAINDELSSGRSVVANVSRSVVAEAHDKYQNIRVIYVTASPEVLAQRLASRGRETTADIRRRLTRESLEFAGSVEVVKVRNDGSLRDTVSQFLDALGGSVHLPAR